ncbi:MAG TPA: lipocalin family protein [Candidatus Limnocylindria bacterium]|nr:lipocalin family protein [Candidatus Limnocylindria bacterium]
MDADGTIDTTFTFRQGGFDGELKRYRPRGFVVDERSNAIWGMQFVWPFKGDFRIAYLDAEYTQTVIGREKRDYAWIMHASRRCRRRTSSAWSTCWLARATTRRRSGRCRSGGNRLPAWASSIPDASLPHDRPKPTTDR